MAHLLSSGLARPALDQILDRAAAFEAGAQTTMEGLVGLMFLEDSVRTRVGFDAAAARLGLRTTTVMGGKHTASMSEAESAEDAVRCVAGWCDALVLRAPDPGLAAWAAETTQTPVVNAGNGREDHPTQALVDLATIRARHGGLDGLRLGLVGDLDGMRAARALLRAFVACRRLDVVCAAPPGLEPPADLVADLERVGNRVRLLPDLPFEELDVVCAVGLAPSARTRRIASDERARYAIGPPEMARLSLSASVLCPMPRVDEIDPAVDADPRAAYFEQSRRGLFVRMAVLETALSG